MHWDVALVPGLASSPGGRTCIVVDELRASTSMVTLFTVGARRIAVAENVAMARRWARDTKGWLLVGEEHSLRPEGFDYGNSPVDLSEAPIAGRDVIMATSNGTRAIHACLSAANVFVGALANRRAVVGAALERGTDVLIVCAGRENATAIAMEDVYVAGKMIELAGANDLGDGATIAVALTAQFATPLEAFAASVHGKRLESLGLRPDLERCAEIDTALIVPRLVTYQRRPTIVAG